MDRIYGCDGAAIALVKNQLAALYTMALAKEAYQAEVFTTAAASFVATNGMTCTLYAMMAYFGGYLTNYKQTQALFDISDILRSYKNRFYPKWANLIVNKTTEKTDMKVTGKPALWNYLRREYCEQGRSIRESDLFKFGFIPEKDVALIESGEPLPL